MSQSLGSSRRELDTEESTLISVEQVAEMLSISVRTVWRLVSTHRIAPPLRIGRLVRWRLVDVVDWIKNGCPAMNGDLNRKER